MKLVPEIQRLQNAHFISFLLSESAGLFAAENLNWVFRRVFGQLVQEIEPGTDEGKRKCEPFHRSSFRRLRSRLSSRIFLATRMIFTIVMAVRQSA
jgi:hypothetical protein